MPYIFFGINLINFIFGPTPTILHKALLLLSQLFLTLILYSIFPRFLTPLHEFILRDPIDISSDIITPKRIGLLFDYYAYGDNVRLFFVFVLINNKHPHIAPFIYATIVSLVCPQCTNGVRGQEIIIFNVYTFLTLVVQLAATRSKRAIMIMIVMALVESNPQIGEIERKIL